MATKEKWADYLNRPLTDEEKRWCHEWSLDWQIEENERLFPTADDADYPRDEVTAAGLLANTGFKAPPLPADPHPVAQTIYTGPTVVEGENDQPAQPGDIGTRVPMPRDHPLTGQVDEAQDADAQYFARAEVVEEQDDSSEWDAKAVKAEISELNVEELKDNLRELEQPVDGNKPDLQKRLYNALKKQHDEAQKA